MDQKKKLKIGLIVVLGILVLMGVIVSILESQQRGKSPVSTEPAINLEANLPAVLPGEMLFLFYEDVNANNQFDFREKVFKNVSVAIRKPGDKWAFVTVPADVNGLVKITNLAVGQYELSYSNHELEQPMIAGDLIINPYYEIIETDQVRTSFLPSDWHLVELSELGLKEKIGLRLYQPKNILVFSNSQELKFYDPAGNKVLGVIKSDDLLKRKFHLFGDSIYYLKDNKLKQLSFKDRLTKILIERLNDVEIDKYWLDKEGKSLIYALEKDWYYVNPENDCQGVPTTEENERLGKTGLLLTDFGNQQAWIAAGTTTDGGRGIYEITCEKNKHPKARKLVSTEVSGLAWLNPQTLFYSDGASGYFYNLNNNQTIKYAALDKGKNWRVSNDKKYIGASLDNKTIIVDYPAVNLSGVEKHYLLPFSGQIVFSGDDVLINQGKEIIRINLLGNGVWEIKDRIRSEAVIETELLGEIKIN